MPPKYDPKTKKFVFPKDEAGVATVSDMAYVAIPKATIGTLVKFAKADGATMVGATPKGVQNAESRVARLYVLQAIEDFIGARGSKA